jgi:DNA-binding NarL/FixJ family response regulator
MGGANATIRVLVADDHPVYVAVLDLRMPGMSAQALLLEAAGECAVLILSVHFGGDDDLLSPREHEILELLTTGASTADIASRLYVSAATVKTHLHQLYEKLGVSDLTAAVAEGMRRGVAR